MYRALACVLWIFAAFLINPVFASNEFAAIDVFPVAPDSIKVALYAQVSPKKDRRLVLTSFSVNFPDRFFPEVGNDSGTAYGWYFMDQENNQFWLGKVIEPDMTEFKLEFILPFVLQKKMSGLSSNRKQLSLTLFHQKGLPNFLVPESGRLLYVPIRKVRLIIPDDFTLVSYPGWSAEGSNIVWNARDQQNDCTLRADFEWTPVGDRIFSFIGFILGGFLSGLAVGLSIKKLLPQKMKRIIVSIAVAAGVLSVIICINDSATVQWVVLVFLFGVGLIISMLLPDRLLALIVAPAK